MDKRKIILDTDPGIDDAVAITVLLKACGERVKLIYTTYGNSSLDNSTNNALSLVSLLGADIPVVRGADKPAPGNGVYEDATHVHGGDGLGGLQSGLLRDLLRGAAIEGDHAKIVYDAIAEEGGADYITLGPLTNLAGLLRRYPDVKRLINRVVTMGGGIASGNVTPHAEFNIYCDAESADYVFSMMPDLALVPLDVTTRAAFGLPAINAIGAAGTPVAAAMAAALKVNYDLCSAFGENGSVMHDATAVLAYLYPEKFVTNTCGMRVECGAERYGKCLPVEGGAGIKLVTGFDPVWTLDTIADSIVNY